jgi:hypothetical protein
VGVAVNIGDVYKFIGEFRGQTYYAVTDPSHGLDLNYLSFEMACGQEFLVLETYHSLEESWLEKKYNIAGQDWFRIITLGTAMVGWIRPWPEFAFRDFELIQKAPDVCYSD